MVSINGGDEGHGGGGLKVFQGVDIIDGMFVYIIPISSFYTWSGHHKSLLLFLIRQTYSIRLEKRVLL
jgi:hypothetical protein